ncbi:MAG: amidophosphoribosyltransferase [Aerococcus sp.]|nr:amidophosphoribosyltransferase [Aerococcus sp.]
MARVKRSKRRLDCVNEAGGLFGIWNQPEASQMTYFGLHALQHRGQQGVGIVTNDGQSFHSYCRQGLLTHVFSNKDTLKNLPGTCALGQVRAATTDDLADDTNLQPRIFHFNEGTLAVSHIGHLTNGRTLRAALEAKGAVFSSNSAAELFIHLLRQQPHDDFETSFTHSLLQLTGSFDFCLLTEHALYAAVDPNSFRPLIIGQLPDGAYLVASETCVLHTLGARFVQELFAGEYAVIDDSGCRVERYANDGDVTIEPMEYIYYARPDSDIAGINVHSARKQMGRQLAKEQPAAQADIVIGVPNSSLSAASGYAEAAQLPYEMGLIKNQYTGRTFIQPTQAMREQGVRSKLSPVPSVVSEKRIVLVDDSIVRGTTIRRLISLLREAGASEIHVRIASPVLRFPNYFGIDVSHNSELVGADRTIPELKELFGCDSLGFLSVEGMVSAIHAPFDTPNRGIALDAFNGEASADIGDYNEEFMQELTPLQKSIRKGAFHDE